MTIAVKYWSSVDTTSTCAGGFSASSQSSSCSIRRKIVADLNQRRIRQQLDAGHGILKVAKLVGVGPGPCRGSRRRWRPDDYRQRLNSIYHLWDATLIEAV
jgi:hypothetical protein